MTQSSSVIWLLPPTALAVGFALALAASLALAWLAAASGPVDRPRTRGAHLHPTPTSGGLAIMAATALALGGALALFGDAVPGGWRDGLIVLLFAAIVGLGGAADDLLDMPAKWRLGFQIVASLVFAGIYHVDTLDFGPGLILTLPSWLSIPGSALWLVLGMNAINFMDGANGLAVGSQFISLSVLAVLIVLMAPLSVAGAWLGAPLMVAVCAAGAHLGFLPWNLPPLHPSRAAVFQGDAGSLFGGALITGLTLMTRNYGVGSVWIGGFVLAPILVDVVLTLFVRARARRNLMRPHKEHLYQLWLQKRDPSHLRLAWRVWLLTLVSSGVGLAARLIDITYRTDLRFIALVGIIFFYSLGWFRLRARLVDAPQTSSPEAAQSSSRS